MKNTNLQNYKFLPVAYSWSSVAYSWSSVGYSPYLLRLHLADNLLQTSKRSFSSNSKRFYSTSGNMYNDAINIISTPVKTKSNTNTNKVISSLHDFKGCESKMVLLVDCRSICVSQRFDSSISLRLWVKLEVVLWLYLSLLIYGMWSFNLASYWFIVLFLF